jgi:membrane-bound inhibitor of C-type lysozyme
VELTLSDGRTLALPQVMSASGARYANHDESFVFWNKGRTAFVEEAGQQTYNGCVQTKQ